VHSKSEIDPADGLVPGRNLHSQILSIPLLQHSTTPVLQNFIVSNLDKSSLF